MKNHRIFHVHRMTAGVMVIAMVVRVFLYKLVDIITLLILIITSKIDTAVVKSSKISKVSMPRGQNRKMLSIYLK